jgi:hypothetical protein
MSGEPMTFTDKQIDHDCQQHRPYGYQEGALVMWISRGSKARKKVRKLTATTQTDSFQQLEYSQPGPSLKTRPTVSVVDQGLLVHQVRPCSPTPKQHAIRLLQKSDTIQTVAAKAEPVHPPSLREIPLSDILGYGHFPFLRKPTSGLVWRFCAVRTTGNASSVAISGAYLAVDFS